MAAKSKGLTLIELLIVLVILGLFFAGILMIVYDARLKTRNAQRETNINQINKALSMYQNDEQIYPIGDYSALSVLVPKYIGKLPKDPLDSDCHKYTYNSDGSTYTLKYCKEPGCGDCPEIKP